MDNPVSAFESPLRYRLKDLCYTFGLRLSTLAEGGILAKSDPARAVTFVDNHDTTQNGSDAVIHDKLLAYACILTHEGYPSVFWLDYFKYGLARTPTPNGIAALVAVHEGFAGGGTDVLHLEHDLYMMQRAGSAANRVWCSCLIIAATDGVAQRCRLAGGIHGSR
jgi:alpha-amylase